MASVKNVLFIMVDQMRADCLGVAGHPTLETPTLDWLASKGTRFPKTYVQSAVCGPARMSFYTGRYVHSHRSYWNGVPLPFDERTLADHVREAGVRAALCGKVHHEPDAAFLARLEAHGFRSEGAGATDAGFEPWERNDFWGAGWMSYLKERGYDLPFEKPMMAAFLVEDADGTRHNGWRFENTRLPTVIREEDSDTAVMTRRAMEFIADAGDDRWLLHLSYVKPHWPNVAPAPYHALYDPADVPPPVRDARELRQAHPILAPFRDERRSLPFDEERTWREMRATYYGLIRQIDDHLGRLFDFLRERGRLDDTLVIFVSDHGEYMGDHWLFEKELFYEAAINVPLIVYDPRPDAARGAVSTEFVESIDLLPTVLEALGIAVPAAVQGRSLLPLLRGERPAGWRDAVFADWDFRFYRTSKVLNLPPHLCRAWMVRDDSFKYVRFNGLPDMLFDLQEDPNELRDLAADPAHRGTAADYRERLLDWRQATEDDSRGAQLMERTGRAGVAWIPEEIP